MSANILYTVKPKLTYRQQTRKKKKHARENLQPSIFPARLINVTINPSVQPSVGTLADSYNTQQRSAAALGAVGACRCSGTVTEPGATRHTWPLLKASSSRPSARLQSKQRDGGLSQKRNIPSQSVTLRSSQRKRLHVSAPHMDTLWPTGGKNPLKGTFLSALCRWFMWKVQKC